MRRNKDQLTCEKEQGSAYLWERTRISLPVRRDQLFKYAGIKIIHFPTITINLNKEFSILIGFLSNINIYLISLNFTIHQKLFLYEIWCTLKFNKILKFKNSRTGWPGFTNFIILICIKAVSNLKGNWFCTTKTL